MNKFSFLTLLAVFPSALACCFSQEQTQGSWSSYRNGDVQYNFDGTLSQVWEVRLTNGQVFQTSQIEGGAQLQWHCQRPAGPGFVTGGYITREQFNQCRDILQYTTPTSDRQLNIIDQRMASATVTLQNSGNSRYITVHTSRATGNDAIGTEPYSQPPVGAQWILQPVPDEQCRRPEGHASMSRTCFSLVSFSDPGYVLATNGVAALRHDAPAHILGYYTLEPTLCTRDLHDCTVRLNVAFYGDRSVADAPNGSDYFLPVPVGSDQDRATAEWHVRVV